MNYCNINYPPTVSFIQELEEEEDQEDTQTPKDEGL